MPSCNLAETIHNKWLRASSNKGGDLYVANVDNYIRAFLQVVAYYQYLKGGIGRLSLSEEELRFRSTQCHAKQTGNPSKLKKALLDMPRVDEFCTRDPHYKGAEVFSSQERKLDMPIRPNNEIHKPDTFNFSCPFTSRRFTRACAASLPTIHEERSSVVTEVSLPSLVGVNICCIIVVQETKVNEKMWHIICLHKNFAKQCWTQMAITEKKYTARVIINSKSTFSPIYFSIWRNVRLNCEEPM